ncbi:MAG: hypothetical protein HDR88_05545 [Bacteroides sp.]|nr:hypothetical protein [Bacteroides sp.]
MIPFLKSIAKAYASRYYKDLSEICFVFPNKRSGTFFINYLKEEGGENPRIAPEVMTITDLVALISGKVVASRLDQLFNLYDVYRELKGLSKETDGEHLVADFDSFKPWGETVIADFSEVDQYMVSYTEIFKNVKDYREISSNFLTDEQKEIITEYFGHSEYGDSSAFWKNFEDTDNISELKSRYFHLWQMLAPLYEEFTRRMDSQGITTTGGSYRRAAEVIREKGREVLPFKKIVMVGFNALSTSEFAIFTAIRDAEGYEGMDAFGDFFWDATGPILHKNLNSASKFVHTNILHFPAPEWARPFLYQSSTVEMPRLRVVASPSKSAQVKIAGMLLTEQRERLSAGEISDAKVAVVLPDEGLLLPMLYSLPEGMGNVNLTMGYSLRFTPVVSFVSLLRSLHGRVRMVGNSPAFYHKDIRLLLGHPFSHVLFGGEEIGNIVSYLDRHHKSVISVEEIRNFSEEAASILVTSHLNDDPSATISYLDGILSKVTHLIVESDSLMINSRLDADHIMVYRDALRRLSDILSGYSVSMNPATVFRLVDRLLAGEKVGFEGKPLTGLQVMGTLETRSVDFDYLTILSMNEGIMPRHARSRSFIPDSLRRAYGMPPSNYAESIFAYYFFRMISRAKEVTMIYDARTGGGGSNEISRYILQLQHLFAKGRIERQDWRFLLNGRETSDASVEKTKDIMGLLKEYEVVGGKNFSASSLSTYRACEVKFFYKSVLGINTDPEPSEYIDAIMVGNILHDVMLNIYVPEKYHKKFLRYPLLIESSYLESLIKNPAPVRLLITRAVNRLHFRLPESELARPLKGGAEMVASQIFAQVMRIIRHDLTLTPFKILGGEIEETLRIPLSSGKIVNFRFAIDRLDEITVDGKPMVRIVDYKTGGLKQEAPDEESIFNGDYKSEQLFQLFTYAWLLGKSSGGFSGDDVRVEIYNLPEMMKNNMPLPKIGKSNVESYSQFSTFFSERMDKMLRSVFENDVFQATDDEGQCTECELRTLCRR